MRGWLVGCGGEFLGDVPEDWTPCGGEGGLPVSRCLFFFKMNEWMDGWMDLVFLAVEFGVGFVIQVGNRCGRYVV